VRNDTVLAFDPAADPERAQVAGLDAWVSRLDDELLPDLVTARGKRLDEVVARLAERLSGLHQQGFAVFRFGDLLAPCKDDVRARWSAILGGEERIEMEGAPAGAAWIQRPGKTYEDLESFRSLVACVLAALERYETTERNRLYLSTLWQYLRLHSVAEGEPEAAPLEAVPGGLRGRRRHHPGRPSDRTLADTLQIPREQLPHLFVILGRLVETCRSGSRAFVPVRPHGGAAP
jgi:hypothetical protein